MSKQVKLTPHGNSVRFGIPAEFLKKYKKLPQNATIEEVIEIIDGKKKNGIKLFYD